MASRGTGSAGRWVAAVLCYAAVASLTRPLTDLATVAVAVPAGIVLVAAARRRRTAGPDPAVSRRPTMRRSSLAWGAVVALAAAWELSAWLQQPAYNVASYDHPTVSLLLDPVTDAGLTRFAAWCVWLYAGWRLVRR